MFAEPEVFEDVRRGNICSLSASRGLVSLGKQRKEFAEGGGPSRAERAGTSESLGRREEHRCMSAEPEMNSKVQGSFAADMPL